MVGIKRICSWNVTTKLKMRCLNCSRMEIPDDVDTKKNAVCIECGRIVKGYSYLEGING